MSQEKSSTQNLHDKFGVKNEELKAKNVEVTDIDDESEDRAEEEFNEADHALKEAQDRLLRAHAEMDNVRRRAERDVASAHKYALEKFVRDLLPIADSLEQALKHAADDASAKAIHDGIELTMKALVDTLKRFGVEQINPVHERFNPELHEAMTMVSHPSLAPDSVVEVFQKGYLLNGRLVRPARVVIVAQA